MCSSSGMASSPMRRALYPSRSLSLVCKRLTPLVTRGMLHHIAVSWGHGARLWSHGHAPHAGETRPPAHRADSLYGRSLAHTRHLLTLRGQVVQETPSPY